MSRQRCFGGCGAFAKPPRFGAIPICKRCAATRSRKLRAKEAWREHREALHVEQDAVRAEEKLGRKESYTPMQGEALILKMQRGEW